MVIVLSEPRQCGKTETLKMVSDQIDNIYTRKIASSEIHEEVGAFKAEIGLFGKKLVIVENDAADGVALDGILNAASPTDILVVEAHSHGLAVLAGRGIEAVTIEKGVKETPNGKMLANIKDCEKILALIEKGLTGDSAP